MLTASSLLWALLLPAAPAHAAGMISALSLSPQTVSNGASSLGTVTLAYADPEDTQVLLFSNNQSVATVPASIVVPAGDIAATFSVATNASAPPDSSVTITAWVGNTSRSKPLLVNPASSGPSLASVAVTPSTLTGGSGATGTVTFSATTDGAVVQLTSSAPGVAQVPTETVVSGGAASGTFAVSTAAVTTSTSVTISASHAGVTRTTTITVSPGEPAIADVVRITRATYEKGKLRINATSTNAGAILSVYLPSGAFMDTMKNLGGGKYFLERATKFPPDQVTVRSNLGGSATAKVVRK